ncbi:hypothetical protein G6F22_015682 [Rhizopus arrhizus]|nr:hypothetical protein G6F22_015682 [Rhizopus arrhizus]
MQHPPCGAPFPPASGAAYPNQPRLPRHHLERRANRRPQTRKPFVVAAFQCIQRLGRAAHDVACMAFDQILRPIPPTRAHQAGRHGLVETTPAELRGIARPDFIVAHIARHHGPCADHRARADGDPRHDFRAGSDPHVVTDRHAAASRGVVRDVLRGREQGTKMRRRERIDRVGVLTVVRPQDDLDPMPDGAEIADGCARRAASPGSDV